MLSFARLATTGGYKWTESKTFPYLLKSFPALPFCAAAHAEMEPERLRKVCAGGKAGRHSHLRDAEFALDCKQVGGALEPPASDVVVNRFAHHGEEDPVEMKHRKSTASSDLLQRDWAAQIRIDETKRVVDALEVSKLGALPS